MNVNVNEVVLTDESKLDTVRNHLSQDETLLTVRDYVIHGWPSNRNIPTEVLPYWPYKDEIGYYNGILLECDPSGVARGGQLPPGAARRGAPK